MWNKLFLWDDKKNWVLVWFFFCLEISGVGLCWCVLIWCVDFIGFCDFLVCFGLWLVVLLCNVEISNVGRIYE